MNHKPNFRGKVKTYPCVFLLVCFFSPAIMADAPTVPGASEKLESQEPAKPPQPKTGPKYFDLRYDENYDYLEGAPESYQSDFFDPLKNIEINDDWRLTLGGEFRFRMEAETNKSFGAAEPAQDTFTLYRYMLHADLKYGKTFRVFAQGIAAFDEDRDLALRLTDENRWDLHQLFFDARILGEDRPWTLRIGRQEMGYGKGRLLATSDWANVRRPLFDGVKLFAKGNTWDVDFWYAKPLLVQRKQRDRFDEDFDLYGAYATYKGIPRHGVDFYLMAVDDTGNSVNPNGNAGDKSTYTMGSRFWGKTDPWDYEAELAGQWGHWAGDTVQAWSGTLEGGYTLGQLPWKPRLGAGFDWASGDEKPTDGKVGTFDQLLPLAHVYFGFLDLVGRQNVTATNVNLSAWPVPAKIRTGMTYHAFWLNADRDALYGTNGAPGRRDPTGESGTEVGQELDLTLSWIIDDHSTLLLGYSHFWSRDFIIDTGSSEDADLFYVQYAFKF